MSNSDFFYLLTPPASAMLKALRAGPPASAMLKALRAGPPATLDA